MNDSSDLQELGGTLVGDRLASDGAGTVPGLKPKGEDRRTWCRYSETRSSLWC